VQQREPTPSSVLIQLTAAPWLSQCITVAANLRIADLLVGSARSVEDLARETATHAPTLYRVLRALAGAGIFAEDDRGCFALTPLAEPLRSDVPGSVRAICALRGEPWVVRAWGELMYCVRTGETVFGHLYGTDFFSYLQRDPETGTLFDESMSAYSRIEANQLQADYDFSGAHTIVDVGGGRGTLLAAILKGVPSARGVLFDLPNVAGHASEAGADSALGERFEAVAGDFFAGVPAGGDVYIVKHVLRDWDDEQAVAILTQCRRAMTPDGRVLVIERIIPPGNGPALGKLTDLNMLVLLGGRERTEAELRSLYERAGLRLTRVIPTLAEQGIVEGVAR
jgi:hypothetical protein